MIFVVVAIAVAVVVVVALLATGVLSTKGAGGGSAGGQSSDSALSTAAAYVKTVPGGPWELSTIGGMDQTSSHTYSFGVPIGLGGGCTSSGTANFTVPAYSGPYSTGDLEAWELVYSNATGQLDLGILNGQLVVHTLAFGSGGDCGPAPTTLGALGANFMSSTAAASASLKSSNVSGFVSTHSSANAIMELYPPFGPGSESPIWSFHYTTCPFFFAVGAPALGDFAGTEVNATSGALAWNTSYSDASTACLGQWYGQPIPPSELFAMDNPVRGSCPSGSTFATNGCMAGDTTYRITVSLSYLPFDGLHLAVDMSVGTYYVTPWPGGFSVLTAQNAMVAQEAITTGGQMATNHLFSFGPGFSSQDLLSANDTVLLDMGMANPTGMGLTFLVQSPFFSPVYPTLPSVALP